MLIQFTCWATLAETLQNLNVMEVLERCMTVHDIAELQKDELRDAYKQILHEACQEDVNSGEITLKVQPYLANKRI